MSVDIHLVVSVDIHLVVFGSTLVESTQGEGERLKARPRIEPEKARRDRGPPPDQWKC